MSIIIIPLLASFASIAHASDEDCMYALEYTLAAQSSIEYAQDVCGRRPFGLSPVSNQLSMAAFQLGGAPGYPDAASNAAQVLTMALRDLDTMTSNPFLSDECLTAITDAEELAAIALEYSLLCDEDPTTSTCNTENRPNVCTVSIVADAPVSCSGSDTPAVMISTDMGLVLSLDMTAYETVQVDAAVYEPSEWVLHLGNSSTNDGYCGDSSSSENDSEAWVYGTNIAVCASDRGGSSYALSDSGVIDASGDQVMMQACDGEFHYSTAGASGSAYSDYIFQIDGDEPESSGVNDQLLYLGIERVIAHTSRLGYGVDGDTVEISFYPR